MIFILLPVLFFLFPLVDIAATNNLDRDVEKMKVKAKLTSMVAEDQALRLGSIELVKMGYSFDEILMHQGLTKATQEVDRLNTEQLKSFVNQWGWITISQFGATASDNAWLLAQHADHDVDFQEKVLNLLTEALKTKDVKSGNVAYLWDRVKVNRKIPQRYGTQGICKGKGKWEPNPLEDANKVNDYRKAVGLPPFSEYLKQVAPMCQ